MLFLLNDQIVDVAVPEMHIERRWKYMGCGYPHDLTARDVVGFVHNRLDQARLTWRRVSEAEARDLAALVIARTGANGIMLKMHADGSTHPILKDIPGPLLDVYARGASNENTSAYAEEPRRLAAGGH